MAEAGQRRSPARTRTIASSRAPSYRARMTDIVASKVHDPIHRDLVARTARRA
jgi:hypothetical protein